MGCMSCGNVPRSHTCKPAIQQFGLAQTSQFVHPDDENGGTGGLVCLQTFQQGLQVLHLHRDVADMITYSAAASTSVEDQQRQQALNLLRHLQ